MTFYHFSIVTRNFFLTLLKLTIAVQCVLTFKKVDTSDVSVTIRLAEGIVNLMINRQQPIQTNNVVNENLRNKRIAKQQFKLFIYQYLLKLCFNLISSISNLISIYYTDDFLLTNYLIALSRCSSFIKNGLNFFLHFYLNKLFYESFFNNNFIGKLLKRYFM